MVEQANEWRIPIFVMDTCVAVAFDHVSHHLIIDAMEALKVPPVLVSAWIREYRRSETSFELDDVMTPGIRRTRPVPQGDPCAAEQPWMFQQQPLVKGARQRSGSCPWVETCMGLLLFADNCWLIVVSPAELKCMARAWNELLEKAGREEAVWCSSAPDNLEAKILVGDTVITRRTREQGF